MMHKNLILYARNHLSFIWWSMLLLLAFTNAFGQLQNNGNLHVGSGGLLYVGATNFIFGTAPATTTFRNTPNGVIDFGTTGTYSGHGTTKFIDGVVSANQNNFTYPVGQTVYAPARITDRVSGPTKVTYYNSAYTDLTFNSTLVAVSDKCYWEVTGGEARLTLSWSTDFSSPAFNATLPFLTIAGYNGTDWVEIPSALDATSIISGSASSYANGSITTTSTVNFGSFQFFTLASRDLCGVAVTPSGNTRTWNGTSWDTPPTSADHAVVTSVTPNSPGSFVCQTLTSNVDITLGAGEYIEVQGAYSGTGKIIMHTAASFVQRGTGTAPQIELTKEAINLRRFNYVYWGTPIAGDFYSQIDGAIAVGQTTGNAFDLRYKYVSGGGANNLWQPLTATETGRGFITRVKEQVPFTDATTPGTIQMKFTGAANNGDITVGVVNNPSNPDGGSSHNLLANPYPSAIDAEKFLRENTAIDGVLYIWRSNLGSNNNNGTAYSQADYSVYTLAGETTTVPDISASFNGKIPSGQGFKVKSDVATGTVTFTNCMRLTGDNSVLFRNAFQTNSTAQVDRFKLNLTNSNGIFSQILVAYLEDGTLGYDRMYDAGRNSVSTTQLYSILDNSTRRLAINARPLFDVTDEVTLGVSKNNSNLELYSIALGQTEGVFAGNQNIYLYDQELQVYHDFSNGAYMFQTQNNVSNNRFKVVYQVPLGVNNPNLSNASALLHNQQLIAQANSTIAQVLVFDMQGRLVQTINGNNTNQVQAPFYQAQGVYVAHCLLQDGTKAIVKLINP